MQRLLRPGGNTLPGDGRPVHRMGRCAPGGTQYRGIGGGRTDSHDEGNLHGLGSAGGGSQRRGARVHQSRVREVPGKMGV